MSAWARSGLGPLTGSAGHPAAPVRDHARRLEALLRAVETAAAPFGAHPDLGFELFTERAAELGLQGRGRISCNGSCRMLRTADGWIAVNLPREDDLDLAAALIGEEVGSDPWASLAAFAAGREAEAIVAHGRLLGLALAVVRRPGEATPAPYTAPTPRGVPRKGRDLKVVDLSAMWAGPLCGRVFTDLGARVTKVESPRRPDAARDGAPRLFARLHAGQASAAIDFTTQEGRARLLALIEDADMVIESSRPRALEQAGIFAHEILARRPGLAWISVTAYGRAGEAGGFIGFGDDVAAGAGLVALDAAGEPAFLGDALADPVAGLTAALRGLHALAAGGGLIDLSMHDAAAAIADAEHSDSALDFAGGEACDGSSTPALATPCPFGP